jgi:arylsulfatase A-like enzyme
MLYMAGLPPRSEQHVDGVSFASLLKGGTALARPAIYWHYPHYSNQGGSPCGAVRAGDWKLIEWYEDNHAELYNLKDDLGEKNDLAAKMPEKAAELRRMPTPAPAAARAVVPTAEELASGE